MKLDVLDAGSHVVLQVTVTVHPCCVCCLVCVSVFTVCTYAVFGAVQSSVHCDDTLEILKAVIGNEGFSSACNRNEEHFFSPCISSS